MRRTSLRLLAAGSLATAGTLIGVGPARAYAPAPAAAIHPGVMMFTEGAQCTANFVYTGGGATYLGYAAHCAGTGAATETNGCLADSLPLGTRVEIEGSDGATYAGTLAYSSWLTMQSVRETDPDACDFNDLALVRLSDADLDVVNPSVPHWGGPNGVNTTGARLGTRVHSYGNSGLRFGVTQLSPKTGTSLGTSGGGWTHPVYTATPGIPGDSGSALLDANGRALGVLSTLAIAPFPGQNNFTDASKALAYANSHAAMGVSIVQGTEAFDGSKLPLGI